MVKNICWIFLLVGLVISSCRKDEEEVDTCSDGILSPGEEKVDCGGPCPPCPAPEPQPYAYARINGSQVDFATYELTYDMDWLLSFSNDTILVVFNLGDGDSLGARPIKALYSKGETQLNKYPILGEGRSVFTKLDKGRKELSVMLEAKFAMDITDPNYSSLDSMFVKEGDFRNIPWGK